MQLESNIKRNSVTHYIVSNFDIYFYQISEPSTVPYHTFFFQGFTKLQESSHSAL